MSLNSELNSNLHHAVKEEENNKEFKELTVEDFPPILYRYIKREHLDSFINMGVVSFGQAQGYFKYDGLTEGQFDDEQGRHYEHDTKRTHFFINGVPIKGLTKASLRLGFRDDFGKPLNYYMLCCSLKHDRELYNEFCADICIKIFDVKTLATFIHNKLHEGTTPLDFVFGGVTYYDPISPPKTNNQVDLIFNKLSRFSNQEEYRFAVIDKEARLKEKRFELSLDRSLEDICNIL